MGRRLSASYACAGLVAVALLTVPLWLLSGLAEAPGLVLLGAVAAVAGVGLGLGVQARLRGERAGVPEAVLANAVLLALTATGLWMYGSYLAEPACATC